MASAGGSAPVKGSAGGGKILIALAAVAGFAGLGLLAWYVHNLPPKIPFGPYADAYASKTDFAEVEHKFPLSPANRTALTPELLKKYDQEQVDQIYARITAGPIPDGPYDGDLFFAKGITGKDRLQEIAGGLKGVFAGVELEKMTLLGRMLWKGKVFYRDQRVLRNRIDHLEGLQEFFPDPAEAAAFREITVHGHTDQLYFPAKLYCGQSLLDSRRESVIIDYAFTDELPGYTAIPDKLAGREGLVVRDEIRMVRPGFYLGRAYAAGSFLLNFTLYNDAIAKTQSVDFQKTGAVAEDCWAGPQHEASRVNTQ
jgi:hypothetical protein